MSAMHLVGRVNGEVRRPPFSDWLAQVDRILVRRIGLDSGSMEDWLWIAEYRCGTQPGEAVQAFLDDIMESRL